MSKYDDIWVLDLIDEFLKQKSIEDDSRDNTHFHSSEFSGCKRQTAYKFYAAHGIISIKKELMKNDPKLQRIFDNGHYMHDRWTSYLEDERCAGGMLKGRWKCKNVYCHELRYKINSVSQDDCHPQIFGLKEKLGILRPQQPCECECSDFEYQEIGFFDPETLLGGHIDALIFLPTGRHVVVDYKSISKYGFNLIHQNSKEEHYSQMQCYFYLTGLKLGKFLYECKDNQDTKEITVVRNEQFIKQMTSDAKKLRQIIVTKKANGKRCLPPRSNSLNPKADRANGRQDVKEYEKGSSECLRCSFRSHCWNS